MPSSVMTRAWPCDSPAVKNLNIWAQFYMKDLRTSGSRARVLEGSRRFDGLHCRCAWPTRTTILRLRDNRDDRWWKSSSTVLKVRHDGLLRTPRQWIGSAK